MPRSAERVAGVQPKGTLPFDVAHPVGDYSFRRVPSTAAPADLEIHQLKYPAIYGIVVALGVAMILGKNPFARLATARAPMLATPSAAAFLDGGLLAPMTLPCTGPVVIGAFASGARSAAAPGESLLSSPSFGVGFGRPLVALPLVAAPMPRGVTRRLARNSQALGRLAGALMPAIAAFGLWVDVLPDLEG